VGGVGAQVQLSMIVAFSSFLVGLFLLNAYVFFYSRMMLGMRLRKHLSVSQPTGSSLRRSDKFIGCVLCTFNLETFT
jgi:hypothetical protein